MKKVSAFSFVKKRLAKSFHWFRKASKKKKIGVIALMIIALIVTSSIISNATKPAPYTTVFTDRADITESVTETGTVVSASNSPVYSPTNGLIKEVYVANGDVVTEGQSLFTVESTATVQEQQQALANYLTAKSALNTAESTAHTLRSAMYTAWDSFRNLATNDTYEKSEGVPDEQKREAAEFQVAQDNWLAAEKKYKDQETAVSQARAALSATWLVYEATQNADVKAPVGGTVTNLAVTFNSTVRSQASATLTSPVFPVLNITNLTTTEVLVSASESDIAKIAEGQEAFIDVSAVDDKEYAGIVRRVDTVGTEIDGVIRYNVYIEITDPDSSLRPGMTSDVEIITEKLENVLSVPNSAVKPYQGGRAVRVPGEKKGETEFIPVRIGIRGIERTEILEGLEEGQEVVTSLSNESVQRSGGLF